MSILELLLVAVGLSMDALAVAICKGLKLKKFDWSKALLVAVFFGGFQAAMPLIGWLLGTSFAHLINSFDHWLAAIILFYLGGKLVYDACKKEEECEACHLNRFDWQELTLLSLATSIDALAVGISLAFLQIKILPAITVIGMTTFILTILGVWLGQRFGDKFKDAAELSGGIILIIIGAKILLSHLLT